MKGQLSILLLLVSYSSNEIFVKTDQVLPKPSAHQHLHLNLTTTDREKTLKKKDGGGCGSEQQQQQAPKGRTIIGGDLNKTIKIGFLTPYNQNQLSLGAIRLAVEAINNDSTLLPGRKLEYIAADIGIADIGIFSSNKLSPMPIRIMTEMRDAGAVAFIGGPEDTCVSEALVAAAWRVPMISYKCSDYQVSEKNTYHTFARTLPPSSKVIKSVVALLKTFSWDQVVLITCHRTRDRWYQIHEYFKHLSSHHKINMTGHYNLLDYIPTNFSKMEEIVEKSFENTRVYVFIGEHVALVDLVRALENRKLLDSGDYIIISADDRIWEAKERDHFFELPWMAESQSKSSGNAFKSVLKLTRSYPREPEYMEILRKFANYSAEPPFNVPFHAKIFPDAELPIEGAYLYDAVMIYARALTEIFANKGDPMDGLAVFQRIVKRSYRSIQGFDVFIDENGDAEGNYTVIAYLDDESGTSSMSMQPVGIFEIQQKPGNNSSTSVDDIPTFRYIKNTRPIQWVGGKPPKSEPPCGFRGENCVYEPDWRTVTGLLVFTSATVVAIVLAARHYLYEQKLACLLWKIDMREVVIPMGPPEPMNGTKSTVALCRQLLGTAVDTDAPLELACKKAYTRIGFYKGMVVAIKPIYKRSIDLTRNIRKELKQIREFRHENIIPFIGASVDHGNICVLTAYSARGSLEDVLQNEDLHLDNMFLASLVADLIKGMIYLHDSEIISHGNLKSSNCLVDSRWVLQIADFGLHEFKAGQEIRTDMEREHRKLLWRAPELLRMGTNAAARGTQKGDVYSFGIVLFEMIGRHGPWGKTQLSVTEIIERVAHPELNDGQVIRPATLHLDCGETILKCLDACWEEDPELRPDFRFIRVRLKEMQAGLKPNIFDNMLSIMEKYACNLEDLVQERTNQLMEEKKKTDALLHRMLPKSVAESLKRGEPVEAESFDSVTIYFSDIVGFTALSAVSTPMQVVELLNDLYTCFDSIISHYDVYKVETIGDAYMVVSGLPLRNGDQHAGEVASMALHLLDRIRNFEIRHRPNERLKLRIGIHSGPVVAGVVGDQLDFRGLKMPRYCLFGDTVNTASRMESSGDALRIHISDVTKELLEILGGYQFTERGIIPIKGKGEMRTYWLSGEDEKSTSRHFKFPPPPPPPQPVTNQNNYPQLTDLGNSVTNNNYNGVCCLASTDKGSCSMSPNKSPNLGCCSNNMETKENHINVLENVNANVHVYKPTTWLLADCSSQSKLGQTSKTGRYVSCSNILQECKASIIKELKRNGSTCATTVCNANTNRFRSAPIITFIESASSSASSTSNPHFHLEEPRFV